jgi:hypothetical protein
MEEKRACDLYARTSGLLAPQCWLRHFNWGMNRLRAMRGEVTGHRNFGYRVLSSDYPPLPAFYCKSLLLDTPAVFASFDNQLDSSAMLFVFVAFRSTPLILVPPAKFVTRCRFEDNSRLDKIPSLITKLTWSSRSSEMNYEV